MRISELVKDKKVSEQMVRIIWGKSKEVISVGNKRYRIVEVHRK